MAEAKEILREIFDNKARDMTSEEGKCRNVSVHDTYQVTIL